MSIYACFYFVIIRNVFIILNFIRENNKWVLRNYSIESVLLLVNLITLINMVFFSHFSTTSELVSRPGMVYLGVSLGVILGINEVMVSNLEHEKQNI